MLVLLSAIGRLAATAVATSGAMSGVPVGSGALIWTSQPTTRALLTTVGVWEDVAGAEVTFPLAAPSTVAVTFTVAVVADKAAEPGGDFLHAARNLVDFVAARLVVDGVPYRQSGAHAVPSGQRVEQTTGELHGTLFTSLGAGNHTVALQWRKWGRRVRSWSNNPTLLGGFTSGRSVVVTAHHKYLWYAQPQSIARVSAALPPAPLAPWSTVSGMQLTFELPRSSSMRFAFSLNVVPSSIGGALRPTANASSAARQSVGALLAATDFVATRLVIDGVAYRDSTSATRSTAVVHGPGRLRGEIVLPIAAGAHTVAVEWRAISAGTLDGRVNFWWSDPSFLDGFVAGRSLSVAGELSPLWTSPLVEYARIAANETGSSLASSSKWRTLTDAAVGFSLVSDASVLVSYSLTLHTHGGAGRTSFDRWGHLRWGGVALRLLIDGRPYRSSGMLSNSLVRVTEALVGQLALELKNGTHTALLQWRIFGSSPDSEWTVLSSHLQDHGGGAIVIALSHAWNIAPVVHSPSAVVAHEDAPLTLNGVVVTDVDASLGDNEEHMSVTVNAEHGTLTLNASASWANLTLTDGSGAGGNKITIVGSTADVNGALAGMQYQADLNWWGDDELSVTANDGGGVGIGGAGENTRVVKIHVEAVNDAPAWSIVASQSVDEDTDLNIGQLAFVDVDAVLPNGTVLDATGTGLFKVELSVQHGRLKVASSNTTALDAFDSLMFVDGGDTVAAGGSATLTFTGTLADCNGVLKMMQYRGDENVNSVQLSALGVNNSTDTLHMVVTDAGTATSTRDGAVVDVLYDSQSVPITIVAVNDAPEVVAPSGVVTRRRRMIGEGPEIDKSALSQTLRISGLRVADADMAANSSAIFAVTIAVASTSSVLRVTSTSGLMCPGGENASVKLAQFDFALSFRGTASAINAALDTLVYRRGAKFDGGDTITMTVSDGAVQAASTIDINIVGAHLDDSTIIVHSIVPSRGSTSGGTHVSIGVSLSEAYAATLGVHGTTLVLCLFGIETTVGTFDAENTRVDCLSPASAMATSSGSVLLRIGVAESAEPTRLLYSSNPVEYVYDPPVVVVRVEPAHGTEGMVLTLRGAKFPQASTLHCQFGFALSAAQWISSTEAKCAVPPAHSALGCSLNESVSTNASLGVMLVPNGIALAATIVDACALTSVSADSGGATAHFSYSPLPSIQHFSPSSGPLSGTTIVAVTLSATTPIPPGVPHVLCRFGAAAAVPASVVNSTIIMCPSPSVLTLENVSVYVSTNGHSFSTSTALVFEYVAPVTTTAVSPSTVSRTMATDITVFGNGFRSASTLRCRFQASGMDEVVVQATFLSTTEIVCTKPILPHASTFALVDVTNNGVDFEGMPLHLYIGDVPLLYKLSPGGGSVSSDTVIQITGSGFVDDPALSCKFTGKSTTFVSAGSIVVVAATWLSSRFVQCRVPLAMVESTVALRISNNGVDFSADALSFQYTPRAIVSSCTPSSAAIGHPTWITVQGSGFVVGTSTACRFGWSSTKAVVLNTTTVLCLSPESVTPKDQAFALIQDGLSAPVLLSVANNGVDFSVALNETSKFTFVQPMRTLSVVPSSGPPEGNINVTLTLWFSGTLPQGGSFFCRFGTLVVPSKGVFQVAHDEDSGASYAVTCVAPPSQVVGEDGSVTVEASSNGVQFTSDAKEFRFVSRAVVVGITPKSGLYTGGVSVQVQGANFVKSNHLRCRFQTIVSTALWVNRTAVICTSPALPLGGVVHVSISNDGGTTFSSNDSLNAQFSAVGFGSSIDVVSATPASGNVAGGSDVVLLGSFDSWSSDVACRFGSNKARARYLNNTHVVCVSPGSYKAGVVAIHLSVDSVNFFDTGTEFEYVDRSTHANAKTMSASATIGVPSIAHVLPTHADSAGGEHATVFGSDFEDSSTLMCRFENAANLAIFVEKRARWLSAEAVECTVPASASVGYAHSVFVNITNDGSAYTANAVLITFAPTPIVTSVEPAFGPSRGGTNVTLRGYNFSSFTALECQFGSVTTRARLVNASAVECASPPRALTPQDGVVPPSSVFVAVRYAHANQSAFGADGAVMFAYTDVRIISMTPTVVWTGSATTLVITGEHIKDSAALACRVSGIDALLPATYVSAQELTCNVPAHGVGDVAVDVTTNGIDFTDDILQLTFETAPRVSRIWPVAGPASGGTAVRVFGDDFVDSTSLECHFGDVSVTASRISAQELECVAPPTSSGEITLTISDGGRLFPSSLLQYSSSQFFSGMQSHTDVVVAEDNSKAMLKLQSLSNSAYAASSLRCSVNNMDVETSFLDNSMVVCALPQALSGGVGLESQLSITFGGVNVTPSITVPIPVRINSELASSTSSYSPLVVGVQPSSISAGSSSQIVVVASKFGHIEWNTNLRSQCRFIYENASSGVNASTAFTDAQWVNDSSVVCYAPSHLSEGVVNITIINGNIESSRGTLRVSAALPAVNLGTTRGHIHGGTIVLITSLLLSTPSASMITACRFGWGAAVMAQSVNQSAVRCIAPASLETGDVALFITGNGVDFKDTGKRFAYDLQSNLHTSPAHVTNISVTALASHVVPTYAADDGSEHATVFGSDFEDSSTLMCRFENAANLAIFVEKRARWLSAEAVECTVPASASVGYAHSVFVNITNDGSAYTANAVLITFAPTPIVTSVEPAFGPSRGGTNVTLRGYNFSSFTALECQFGSVTTRARLVNASAVECASPPRALTPQDGVVPPSSVFVAVRYAHANQSAFGADGAVMFAYTDVRIISMTPTVVWTGSATTLVITGEHIKDSAALACRVSGIDALLPATYVSAQELTCNVPAHGVGDVAVDVTTNGIDFTDDILQLTFETAPRVSRIWPVAGPASGGTAVRVFGDDFVDSTSLECHFGDVSVTASRISAQELECTTPTIHSEGAAPFAVGLGGITSNRNESIEFLFAAASSSESSAMVPLGALVAGLQGGTTLWIRLPNATSASGDVFSTIEVNCTFDGTSVVPTTFGNTTHLACTTPAHTEGIAHLAIEVSQLTASGHARRLLHDTEFRFEAAPEILSISPSSGLIGGGETITVHLAHALMQGAERGLKCDFGIAGSTDSLLIDDVTIHCITPTLPESVIGPNAVHASTFCLRRDGDTTLCLLQSRRFIFKAKVFLIDVKPSRMNIAIGSKIVLTTSHNLDSNFGARFGCRIATHIEWASVVSKHQKHTIECIAPTMIPSTVSILLVVAAPDEKEEVVVTDDDDVHIVPASRALQVRPAFGSVGERTEVYVHGASEYISHCIFNASSRSRRVPATRLNGSTISCIAPADQVAGTSTVIVQGGHPAAVGEFMFLPRFYVNSLSPEVAPIRGNANITVTTTTNASALHICGAFKCQFTNPLSGATVSKSAEAIVAVPLTVVCTTPRAAQLGLNAGSRAQLRVVCGDATFAHSSVSSANGFDLLYQPRPFVWALSPPYGSADGGYVVNVRGGNFIDTHQQLCVFGDITPVVATWVSNSVVSCVVPFLSTAIHGTSHSFNVRVINRGTLMMSNALNDTSDMYVRFIAYVRPTVTSVVPNEGSMRGNELVRVMGVNFMQSGMLMCAFGNRRTVARRVSHNEIYCLTPLLEAAVSLPNTVHVRVVFSDRSNSNSTSSSNVTFTFTEEARVLGLKPNVSSTNGQTRITISGSGFMQLAGDLRSVQCQFGNVSHTDTPLQHTKSLVPATVLDERSIECTAPAFVAGYTWLRVVVDDTHVERIVGRPLSILFQNDFKTRDSSAAAQGDDGGDDAPRIFNVSPLQVYSNGGVIDVFGSGFRPTRSLACRFTFNRFGVTDVFASFVNTTHIVCATPRHREGSVNLSVSVNGEQWSAAESVVRFISAPEVHSVSPSAGSISGGTVVNVSGYNFVSGPVVCKFGAIDGVSGVAVSSTLALCHTVPGSVGAAVSVTLSFDGEHSFASSSAMFSFLRTPAVAHIAPVSGYEGKSTVLSIVGHHFEQSPDDLWCRFGSEHRVRAEWKTMNNVLCIAPASLEPGTYMIGVSANGGAEYSADAIGAIFNIAPRTLISHITPLVGSTTGNTTVNVWGSNFAFSSDLACTFGLIRVAATFVNTSLIMCTSPPSPRDSTIFVDVSTREGSFDDLPVFTYVHEDALEDARSTGTAAAPISTIYSVAIDEQDACILDRFLPIVSPVYGSGIVDVFGTGFTPTSTLSCRFGTVDVPASFVNASHIICATPHHEEEYVRLSVSVDGERWCAAKNLFGFISAPQIHSISPSYGTNDGGTVVNVTGENFVVGSSVACKFGGIVSDSVIVLSSTLALCSTPAGLVGASVAIAMSFDDEHSFARSSAVFSYQRTPVILSVAPVSGQHGVSTVVSVHGHGFEQSSDLWCRFGSTHHRVRAEWQTSTSVLCVSPTSLQPGTYMVGVSGE